jgi:hypothetical protein
MESTKTAVQSFVFERIRNECRPVDINEKYDAALDDSYQHDDFFQRMHILPSRALKELDPTAYQCGLNDYVDYDEGIIYIDGEYYNRDDVQEVKDAIIAEVEAVKGDEN